MRAPNPKEVRSGLTATFRFRPPDRWTSATGLVKDPSGQTDQTPTPTVDTVDTTVAAYASADRDTVKLTSVAGVSRGVVYQVTDDQFGTAQCEVAAVDSAISVVSLVEPLPATPGTGAAFQGVEVSMTITAITDRDRGYRAIVRGGTDGQEEVVEFAVVYQPWTDPLGARDVRRYVARLYPNDPLVGDEERCADVAQEACDQLRVELSGANRYADRYFDKSDLFRAAKLAMMLVLSEMGIRPGGTDPTDFRRSLTFDLRDRVGDILQSNVPYDADGNDALDGNEASGIWAGSLLR